MKDWADNVYRLEEQTVNTKHSDYVNGFKRICLSDRSNSYLAFSCSGLVYQTTKFVSLFEKTFDPNFCIARRNLSNKGTYHTPLYLLSASHSIMYPARLRYAAHNLDYPDAQRILASSTKAIYMSSHFVL
jgi:hypothetical protein